MYHLNLLSNTYKKTEEISSSKTVPVEGRKGASTQKFVNKRLAEESGVDISRVWMERKRIEEQTSKKHCNHDTKTPEI